MRPGSWGSRPGRPAGAGPQGLRPHHLPPCRRRPSGSLPPTPASRPACATAPSPSCWRGEPLEITTYRVDGVYSDARHPDGVTFTRSLRQDAPGGTLPSTPWPTPARGCRTSSGGRRTWPRGPSAQWAGRRPAFTRTPCASSGPCGLLPCWTSPWRRRPTRPPWPAPPPLAAISPERVFSELGKLLCGKAAGRVLRTYPQVLGGGGAGDPPHGGV